MKAILVIQNENTMKELVRILAKNGYEINVKKTGDWWEDKYQVEVSKDESHSSD